MKITHLAAGEPGPPVVAKVGAPSASSVKGGLDLRLKRLSSSLILWRKPEFRGPEPDMMLVIPRGVRGPGGFEVVTSRGDYEVQLV